MCLFLQMLLLETLAYNLEQCVYMFPQINLFRDMNVRKQTCNIFQVSTRYRSVRLGKHLVVSEE